jgi:hypothetical protein
MLLDRFRVQPAEVRKFTVDYSLRLPDPNVLASIASIAIDVATTPPFMVAGEITLDLKKVVLTTQGGLDANDYKADITVTTAEGQTWQDEIIFICEEI